MPMFSFSRSSIQDINYSRQDAARIYVWNPCHNNDINKLESLQHSFTC